MTAEGQGHRSRGPWRYRGRRASAQKIMETYRALDRPTPWLALVLKYGGVMVVHGGRPVAMRTLRRQSPRETLTLYRQQIAFHSRFDSMATPAEAARVCAPWEWSAP